MAQKRILVVEDEPDIALLITRSLDIKKYQIIQATTGAQSLQILETLQPDLILLDIMMPDINGFEICRRIKAQPQLKDIPVVFLTVRNSEKDIELGREMGAAAYFTKPFDPFVLRAEIEKMFE
ncbi:response regulator [candidate division FCPU426 bacterium]|nr:response regulator [candidate division FCPU426 bacterium]